MYNISMRNSIISITFATTDCLHSLLFEVGSNTTGKKNKDPV